MTITDEQLKELLATPAEKRVGALLYLLFTADVLDDDAYTDAVIRAEDGAPC